MPDWLLDVLLLGSFYAALGVGFSLYFGALRLINLAHGESLTMGAFAALAVSGLLGGLPGPIAAAIMLSVAVAVTGALGAVVEVVAFRGIRGRQPFVLLLTSVAVSIILREGLAVMWPNGANPHPFPDPFEGLYLAWPGIRVSKALTVILLVVASISVVLIVMRTALGRKLRAVAQDPTAAALMGINVDRSMVIAFALASSLAGFAGCLHGMCYGMVRYDIGLGLGLRGFAAAAIGGIHSSYGGLLGGFLLALFEITAGRWLPGGSLWRDVVVFGLLIGTLAWRPQGILGMFRHESGVSWARRRDGKSVL
ncbi:MAG: branched-chain amino acid ABC transporter permease [Candidatus Marinimicrobia bacterium]|nr:branched-chain amino acid ABC transporter permease [Candidatus Neomarinimicrobiota bacterium]